MRPFLGGGDMIREVRQDAITYADPPLKFEAGTPPIVSTIGLGAALDYVTALGMDNIAAHERGLRDYAQRAARRAQLAEPAGHGAGQGGDLLLHARRRRRTRTTSRRSSTARASRCAPGTTAPSR